MVTRCLNCGLILTTSKGKRLHSAHFDSSLPYKAQDGSIWARCDDCYRTARPEKQVQKWTVSVEIDLGFSGKWTRAEVLGVLQNCSNGYEGIKIIDASETEPCTAKS